MVLKDSFKIGDIIKVGVQKRRNETNFYDSKIADIVEEEGIFKIYNISSEKSDLFLEENEKISIMKEEGSIIFMFSTRYVGKDKGKFDYLVLSIPKEVERMQRREFYRLPINVKIDVKKENKKEIYLGETLDLSGNGLSVDLDAELDKDERVIVNLPLTEKLYIDNIYGKISRVGKGELLPYRYGIKFTDIELEKKEKLISYIFEVQRMRIKLAKSMENISFMK